MKWLTIEYIHEHSRIDYNCEDAVLELYGTAAEDAILNLCRRTYDNLMDIYGDIPAKLRAASLLLCDHMYQNRGITTPGNMAVVPYGFDMMVREFMVLTGCTPIETERNTLLGQLATVAADFDFGYGSIEAPTEEQAEAYIEERKHIADLMQRYGDIAIPTPAICQSLRQVVAAEKEKCDSIINPEEQNPEEQEGG
jgi:uncharacterized phage protein (predicted DNA packaging)